MWYSETLWPAEKMRAGDWTPVQWFNPKLAHVAGSMNEFQNTIQLQKFCTLHYTTRAFTDCFTTEPATENGNAFCGINETVMQTVHAHPESIAITKPGYERQADTLWQRASRLLIASRFRTTSTRLLAIYSTDPAASSAYYAMAVASREQEKAFAAFMNSSFGVIQMLNKRAKTLDYPKYEVGHLKALMLPDPATADLAPLLAAFAQVKDTPLQRLAQCNTDPARRILDHAAAKALGVDPALTDQWREWLSQEPTITNRPAVPACKESAGAA